MATDPRPSPSSDFRRFFANWFSLRVSDNDVSIVFGLEDQKGVGPVDGPVAEAQVIMTPRSLKVLMILLRTTIEGFEKDVGPIALGPNQEAQILARMKRHAPEKPKAE